jgi:uncharacterized protein YndB with AHSA1/START domain
MPRLKVATTLDAPPERVWADIEDIASHVEWMQDAVAIEFTSDIDSGVGTTFDCATRIGPFRLTDHMEITSWRPGREMGVRHVGMVTGSGAFTLTPVRSGRGRRRRDRTRFVWTERLKFPWYFGGPIGAVVARPVLRHVWRTNLRNLAERFER